MLEKPLGQSTGQAAFAILSGKRYGVAAARTLHDLFQFPAQDRRCRMSVPRTSLAAMALGCAICFAGAAAWAQPAGEQVLSTQDLTVTEGAFGLNDAIQAGEMRRRTAAGPQASAPQPLAPEPAYARYPQYKGTIGDVP